MNFGSGSRDRYEQRRFKLELDKGQADKFRDQLSVFPPHIGDAANAMIAGDELKITYDVNINYWGNVVPCLEALKKILSDPAVVLSVQLEELRHSECLIATVLDKVREVQEIIRQRA